MKAPAFSTRLFLVFGALVVLAVGGMFLAALFSMSNLQRDVSLFTLERSAAALAAVAPQEPALAQDFCVQAADVSRLRLTIVGPDGTVWGDSRSLPATMVNHIDRPEVREALRGSPATRVGTSGTLGIPLSYAAAPIVAAGRVVAALRLAIDTPELAARLRPFTLVALAVALGLGTAGALASATLGRKLARPLRSMTLTAQAWSAGQLDNRVRGLTDPDFLSLADTMNAMAGELATRITAAETSRAETTAILAALGEGVIAVDGNLTVRLANPRAAELLVGRDGLPAGSAAELVGSSLLKVSGSAELERLVLGCLAAGRSAQDELVIYGPVKRFLMAVVEPLALPAGGTGAVIALGDLTSLRQLERVRKDFVANVSHELRTPITLIKGFAETIESGAVSLEEAGRFTAIIRRHADRMAAIIEDLLLLASLEAGGERRGQPSENMETILAADLLRAVGESAQLSLAERRVGLAIDCPPQLRLPGHAGLLEQALVNLVANAARYGPEGGLVELTAKLETRGGYVAFSVLDRGPGIPEADRPRIFERFYRVDKARGRQLGGTGLGLAIVKHIAAVHGGDINARPRVGGGSEFVLRVPLDPV
ncbi:MAG: hypothetical protein A2087_13190 [Spirochaetes bacterium GWD1_61_31]|nr:MAG: hypothetical protein A2Y37_02595 [Spirochaetes bacterium GWB1_60_80]OHD39450.1 MAG: hypothetical protein A2087_13190 [Spirochaetes bacterium GWD1_61_31]OHD45503.1 MAG: hypothetical protein A2Y35_02865 [Spirochaetes bacterium GWE1_60_18]OHD58077.1 MAG: hypothetical protein A2Y32_05440 [Spirochaetes bacterium GWF1_60_12]HAP44645.1 hypothetical protein [Spirochaetaceae bacterium]